MGQSKDDKKCHYVQVQLQCHLNKERLDVYAPWHTNAPSRGSANYSRHQIHYDLIRRPLKLCYNVVDVLSAALIQRYDFKLS